MRRSAGLSRTRLAEKLGIAKQSVCNGEKDNMLPLVEKLCKIADFFHAGTDFLLCRKPPAPALQSMIDAAGLTPAQIEGLRLLVDDLRGL